jgi:hypothetical protein
MKREWDAFVTEHLSVGTIGSEDDEQNNDVIEDYAAFRQHKRIVESFLVGGGKEDPRIHLSSV